MFHRFGFPNLDEGIIVLGGSSQVVSKWLGSPPIYKPFSWPFGRGPIQPPILNGDNNDHHMVINHLQVMG